MPLIQDLLDLEIPGEVKLSPNCQQVLYSTAVFINHKKEKEDHPVSTLWLARTGDEKSSQQLTSGQFNDKFPAWSPDGNSIAFISDRAKKGESSAIYILPLTTKPGGEAYAITPADNESEIESFKFSPDGKFIAYVSADEKTAEKKAREKEKDDANVWGEDLAYARLRIVHVATKKVSTLVSGDRHVKEFDWKDDGKKIVFSQTKNPRIDSTHLFGDDFFTIDLGSKEIEHVGHLPKASDNLLWVGEEEIFAIGHVSPEYLSSSRTVYSLDLEAAKKEFRRRACGETDCAQDLVKAGRDLMVRFGRGMNDDIEMLDGKKLLGQNTWLESWDARFTSDSDEIVIALRRSSADKPEEVFTTTASGGALVQVSNHGEAVKNEYSFGSSQVVSCQSADGKASLEGIFYTPAKAHSSADGKKPLPTAVLVHGGPYWRSVDSFDPCSFLWGTVLLASGYGVLTTNYRGSSCRGDDFAAPMRGGVGTVDYDDVISLTQHAIEQGLADKERLVIGGWSQGGFMSYIASVRNGLHGLGWKFQAAIPGAGVADADTMCYTSDFGATFELELAGVAPWRSEKSSLSGRRGSAVWEFKKAMEIGGVVPPMLILHGEKDERCPFEQAVMMRRALADYGLPFEFVSYPREPHTFKERKHIADVLERVVRFVDTYIGGGAS